MTITFGGRWQLRPMDSRNWELWHLHETATRTRGGRANADAGKAKWHPCGRYYSYSTVEHALLYAADCEMKNKNTDAATDIRAAMDEWRATLDGFLADARDALAGARG